MLSVSDSMEKAANIFDIQHFSLGDGPGIRTTVFFKGCPLRCVWCHNPESYEGHPQVMLTPSLCTACGKCAAVCSRGCHDIIGDLHNFSSGHCTRCGLCVKKCAASALKMVGKSYTTDEVLQQVLPDRIFYETSGGGVTLSGGECLAQSEFCGELLRKLKTEGIHTAVDTSGMASRFAVDTVLPYTDLFLYDIKAFHRDTHIRCTGQPNDLILENLRYLSEMGAEIEVRIPYIPGWNDGEMPYIAEFLESLLHYPAVRVLPYHNYAAGKFASLGLGHIVPDLLPTEGEIRKANESFAASRMKDTHY